MNDELERYLAINTAFRERGTELENPFFMVLWTSLILGLVVVSIFAAAVLLPTPAGAF